MQPGATILPDGVRFVVHAATAPTLCLFEGEGERRLPMARAGDLWSAFVPGLSAGARYLTTLRDGRAIDPVANFHLSNGASLERLNWMANPASYGLEESLGLMVNYRYDLTEIERNHEAYAQDGTVAASRSVRALLKSGAQVTGLAATPDLLALPSASKAKRARSMGTD